MGSDHILRAYSVCFLAYKNFVKKRFWTCLCARRWVKLASQKWWPKNNNCVRIMLLVLWCHTMFTSFVFVNDSLYHVQDKEKPEKSSIPWLTIDTERTHDDAEHRIIQNNKKKNHIQIMSRPTAIPLFLTKFSSTFGSINCHDHQKNTNLVSTLHWILIIWQVYLQLYSNWRGSSLQ